MHLLILIIITVAGLGFALLPFVRRKGTDDREDPTRDAYLQQLLERREKQIQGLKDLETERSVGNMDEEEYKSQREQYIRQAAGITMELEKMGYIPGTDHFEEQAQSEREQTIEEEISEIRENLE